MNLRLSHFSALLVFVAHLCVGCGGATQSQQPVASLGGVVDDRLGNGDVFEIRIYGEDELGGKYQIGADGVIDFPLLGQVDAVGKTPTGLAAELTGELKARGFMKDPHVSVLVTESTSKRITVIGAVAKPATFPLTPGLSLVQAISLAGGFSSLANKNGTVVTRRDGGRLTRFPVPVDDVARGAADDILLYAGDIIFVPERVF